MTRFLPLIISLFVIRYSLFVSPSFAQEINPQAGENAWENFKNLFIPDTLKQVNCAGLPLEVCTGIKSTNTNSTDNGNSGVKTQGNSNDNTNAVIEGAFQYDVRSGEHLPSNIAQSSTNKKDVFAGILDWIKNIGKIFDQGNEKAEWSAKKDLPADTGNQIITKQSAMNDSLLISQCGGLPGGLCGTDNKPNIIQ